jgi:hypothetical protein
VVVLPLESDAACTSLNGHSAWKSALLVLVWCYKATGDREQDLWGYWLPEGCIKQCYGKPAGDGCLQEVRAGEATKQWHRCILYLGQALWHTVWKHKIQNFMITTTDQNLHCWSRWVSASFTVSLGLWAFCQAVLLLTYVVATKMWSCHELDPLHIIHILGFITPNFLPTFFTIMAAFAIFQTWIWVVMDPGKFLIDLGFRNFSTQNYTVWEHASTWLAVSLRYCSR